MLADERTAGTDDRRHGGPIPPQGNSELAEPQERTTHATADHYQPQGNRVLAEPQERTTDATADQYQPHGNRVLAEPAGTNDTRQGGPLSTARQ